MCTRELNDIADGMLCTGMVRRIESSDLMNWVTSDHRAESLKPGLGTFQGMLSTLTPERVDEVLMRALEWGASDIHIEPESGVTRFRFRVDGHLREWGGLPMEEGREFVSRLKVLCNMDIAEKRRPQDGRFRFEGKNESVDVRASTIPMESGEKMVLRLLDRGEFALQLDQLGLGATDEARLREAISKPQGIVLVTGPTGSGKTTTLYTCLRAIRHPRLNILTVEDPIEYRLEGVNQSQVKTDIGYTFASALRAFLRQDPNVIMVGEIRDTETVQIALRAAMTGHLVLSTVHTNDAAATIARLFDLGAAPYLVASSISLIVAQRLVRRLCTNCCFPDRSGPKGTYLATGCTECQEEGYRGRVGVYEMLPVAGALQEMIHDRASAGQLREYARGCGMRCLADDARGKWLGGLTTREEIEREIGITFET